MVLLSRRFRDEFTRMHMLTTSIRFRLAATLKPFCRRTISELIFGISASATKASVSYDSGSIAHEMLIRFRHCWYQTEQYGGAYRGDHRRRVPSSTLLFVYVQQQQGAHSPLWSSWSCSMRSLFQRFGFLTELQCQAFYLACLAPSISRERGSEAADLLLRDHCIYLGR